MFSDVGTIHFTFDQYYNKDRVLAALQSISHPNGNGSDIRDALTKAKNEAFAKDRDPVPDAVIILTKTVTENVSQAASALKSDGVKITVVAIGGDRANPLLRDLPSEPKEGHLFTPPSFDDLELLLWEVLGNVEAGLLVLSFGRYMPLAWRLLENAKSYYYGFYCTL